MKELNADICIIGGGAAGLSMAAGAAQMGAKTVLFEAGKLGGDCLNYGCIPSKTLIANAKTAFQASDSRKQGVLTSKKPDINFEEIKQDISNVINKIAPHDSKERFEALGVSVFEESAWFTGRRQISSDTVKVNFRYAVIATGTRPFIPDIKGISDTPYFTNESIFSLTKLPDHLIILGGGAIGIELAQAFTRLGSKVSIIEENFVLHNQDEEFKASIWHLLKMEGVSIYEQSFPKKIAAIGGRISVHTNQHVITGTHLLIATGRIPSTTKLKLENAGIATQNGLIKTNQHLRTDNKRIYAIGDVATTKRHTNMASAHASVAIQNILLKVPTKINPYIIPYTIYVEPELSHVGFSKHEAEQKFGKHNIICLSQSFETNNRSATDGSLFGLVQLITKKNGRLIGATIFAPHAGELIQTCTFAITQKLKLSALARLNFPYPSYGEAIKYAAGSFYSKKLFGSKMRWLVNLRFKLLS